MDQSLVTSGFDIELLIGNRYIEYLLLSFTETGSFPLQTKAGDVVVDIFQPNDVDRTYEPHPDAVPLTGSADSFNTQLIFNHPSGANVRIDFEVWIRGQFITAFASFGLVSDTDAQGNPVNHRIRIEVKDIELTPELKLVLEAAGISEEELLARIKEQADRDVPLLFVGAGSDIERIEMRQLPSMDGGPIAIGFYMNLRLRNGPEPDSFLPDRGDVFHAMNFLEHGRDIAFAIRKDLLADLSAHQKFLFAEPDGSGGFHFPLRRTMFDPSSEQIGKLFDITIRPTSDMNGQFTGEISVRIRGEYAVEDFFDPDFTFTLTLTPRFDDGIVTWSYRTDLDSKLAAILSFLVLGFVGLIGYAIATEVVDDRLLDDAQKQQMSRFLESLPVRVPVEVIRWDPFYATSHQIVTRVDEWIVNARGIAFAGRAALAKQTEPVDHVVLRTEVRNSLHEIERLEYRVRDHASHARTLDQTAVFPATDRLDWGQNAAEPTLFGLTPDQVVERIAAKKINGVQELLPRKVHIDDHRIFRMLCITPREVQEQIRVVEDRFRNETRAQIASEQGQQLRDEARAELEAELGAPPTPQQVEERFRQRLETLVAQAFEEYRAGSRFEQDLEEAVDAVLRLDMAPDEFGRLQRRGILNVLGYELIERHNRKVRPGTITLYYRDLADGDPKDNLLNMLRYALAHAGH